MIMLSIIKPKLQGTIEFIKTATALYVAQIPLILVPLVITPMYAKFMTKNDFSLIVLCQSVGLFMSIFAEYNFTLSAGRMVAEYSKDKDALSNIVSGVTTAKIFIGVVLLIIGIPLLYLILHQFDLGIAALAILYGILIGFSPFWFFQAMKNVARIVSIDVCFRTAGSIASVAVCYMYPNTKAVMATICAFYLVSVIITHYIIKLQVGLKLSWKISLNYIADGFPLFFTKMISSAYLQCTPLLLGNFLAPTQIAGFVVGERFMRFVTTSTAPINNAVFPRIVRSVKANFSYGYKLTLCLCTLFAFIGILCSLILVYSSKYIVAYLLANRYSSYDITIFSLLALFLPFAFVNSYLGSRWLVALNRESAFNKILLVASVLHVSIVLLVPTKYKVIASAISISLTESIIFFSLTYISVRSAKERK